MSWLSDIFGGGSKESATTTKTSSMPAWYEDAMKSLVTGAGKAAAEPWQQYGGPRIASLTEDQTKAFEGVRGIQGKYDADMADAVKYTKEALVKGTKEFPDSVDRYMSPYTKNVTDRIAQLGQRNLSENLLPQVNSTFTGAGQFGSSRNAEFTNRALRDTNEAVLGQQSQALERGYATAADIFNQDQTRAMRVGENIGATLGNLAGQRQSIDLRNLGALEAAGQQQQGQTQRNYDTAYGDFQEQRGYPWQQLGNYGNVVRGTNVPVTTTETGTKRGGGSTLSNIVGTASGIYGMGSEFGWWGKQASQGKRFADGGTIPEPPGRGFSGDLEAGFSNPFTQFGLGLMGARTGNFFGDLASSGARLPGIMEQQRQQVQQRQESQLKLTQQLEVINARRRIAGLPPISLDGQGARTTTGEAQPPRGQDNEPAADPLYNPAAALRTAQQLYAVGDKEGGKYYQDLAERKFIQRPDGSVVPVRGGEADPAYVLMKKQAEDGRYLAQDGRFTYAPGITQSMAAKVSAEEQARQPFDQQRQLLGSNLSLRNTLSTPIPLPPGGSLVTPGLPEEMSATGYNIPQPPRRENANAGRRGSSLDAFAPMIERASQETGVPQDLIQRVIMAESSGNPSAVSNKGATGLMQLMPATAKGLGVDPRDPAQNIQGGSRYLGQMMDKYDGDQRLALAAYNWGPGNVDRWVARGANEAELPAETRGYIQKIMSGSGSAQTTQASAQSPETPSLAGGARVIAQSNVPAPGSQEGKRDAVLGEHFGKKYVDLQADEKMQKDMLRKMERLGQLSEDLSTGKFATQKLEASKIAAGLGLDPQKLGLLDAKGIGAAEAVDKISKELILDMAKTMTGVISDNDIKFLTAATDGLSTTPEGRKILLEGQRLATARAAEVAKMARSYKGGKLDSEFEAMMADRYQSSDMFTPEFIQRANNVLAGKGGQSQPQAPGQAPRQNWMQELPAGAKKHPDGYYEWKDPATGRMIRLKEAK